MNFEGSVNYQGIEFGVAGEYSPFIPGRPYLRNGDPGYPDEEARFEEFDILIGSASIFELLTQAAIDGIENLALDAARYAARRERAWA